MTQGLLKRLALTAPLVLCLPLCTIAADGSASSDDEMPKIFEEFSLTSASTEAPTAAPSALPSATACVTSPACAAPSPACCGTCDNALNCCCEPPCLFLAGVEATMFHASTHGMSAASNISQLTAVTNPNFGFSSDEAFDRFTFSPRVFAGVQDNCWGIMGRFWYLSDSAGQLNPFLGPAKGVGVDNFERMKAYTIDLEISRSFCVWTSKVDAFIGARYASFEAGQGMNISGLTTPAELTSTSAFNSFTFNGAGITMGFLGRTPISCDYCVSLLWGARGSVIFGEASRQAQTSATVIDTGANATSINGALSQNDDTAFIIEALLGVQWDHQLQCLPMSAYLRLAFEYQYWDLGSKGNAAAASFATSVTGAGTSSASVGDVNAQFIGLMVGTGFNW